MWGLGQPPSFANAMLVAWVWKGLVCVDARPAGKKKKSGGGRVGGAQPRPFANAILAAWVWKGLVCFEASLPGLKKKSRGVGGGAQPTPFANAMLAAWVWNWYALSPPGLNKNKRAGGLGGAQPAPPICKRNARSMGLEGTRMR